MLRRAPLKRGPSPLVRGLQQGYSTLLAGIVRRPAAAYSVVAVALVAGALIVPQLGQSLFPTFKQRDLLIHFDAIPGTSDTEMVRATTMLSQRLQAIPGVRSFGAHIGRARGGEEVVGIDAAEAWISTDPKADYDKVVGQVRDVVDTYPGMYRDVETYLNERIEEVLSGSRQAVTVRIYGQNLDQIRATATDVLHQVTQVHGVEDPHMDISVDTPQIQIEVDLARAAAVGLKPGDVRRQAAAVVAGQEMGNIFMDSEIYGVYVWSIPTARASTSAISDMRLDTPGGGQVRLGDIATVSMRNDPYRVTRDGNSRYLDVSTDVKGRDLGAVANDIRNRVRTMAMPAGMHYAMLGEYKERQAAQRTLLTTAIVAAAAILLLLQLSFGSWRLAGLLFVTLPMALVGGVIAIAIGGAVITIGALVGFFTVFGIAARNGILLINHCQHLERREGMDFGPALVVRGRASGSRRS
jgi:Cu/Ag efflux pump CusA